MAKSKKLHSEKILLSYEQHSKKKLDVAAYVIEHRNKDGSYVRYGISKKGHRFYTRREVISPKNGVELKASLFKLQKLTKKKSYATIKAAFTNAPKKMINLKTGRIRGKGNKKTKTVYSEKLTYKDSKRKKTLSNTLLILSATMVQKAHEDRYNINFSGEAFGEYLDNDENLD